jgi:hypothetical protein
VLVHDNLNTHSPASLYNAFPPAEAARIRARFDSHFTPGHGNWLNIAEIELRAPSQGCLARRVPNRPALARELRAWRRDRNQSAKNIRWQFTTAGAHTRPFNSRGKDYRANGAHEKDGPGVLSSGSGTLRFDAPPHRALLTTEQEPLALPRRCA